MPMRVPWPSGTLSAALALAVPCCLTGQQVPLVHRGVRVRVTLESDVRGDRTMRVIGTLTQIGPDSIAVYDQDRLAVTTAALGAALRLEVSCGRHSHTGRGALIGLAAGTLGGVISGLILCRGDACTSSGGEWSGVIIGVLGVGGALAGTGVGALVGSLIRSERWETVPLGTVEPSRGRYLRD